MKTTAYFILIVFCGQLIVPAVVNAEAPLQEQSAKQEKVDCYFEGEDAASEYTGGGALAGGLASGFFLGFIGWGLGYVIISGSDPDVPSHYLRDMSRVCRRDFSDGYKKVVLKKKKSKFNSGGAIGTVVVVLLLVSGG